MNDRWYDLYQAARRVLFEPLFLLTGFTPEKYQLTQAEKSFIEANSKFWQPLVQDSLTEPIVLVYGHMAGEGVNYLTRLGMIGRGLAEEFKGSVRVVLPRCQYNSNKITKLFRSFAVEQFVYLKEMDWHLVCRFKALILALSWYLRSKDVDELLQISFRGIAFGDVIYNDIIKEVPGLYHLQELHPRVIKFLFRFFLHALVFDKLLQDTSIKFLVTTHIQYIMFGTLVRLALVRGIIVIESTDMTTNVFRPEDLASGIDYFSHTRKQIVQKLNAGDTRQELVNLAEQELEARVEGKLNQIDVQLAYAGKNTLDRQQLRKALGESNERPIVSIFTHVFSDCPLESSRQTIYRDYYQWIAETLKLVVEIPTVRWIIKPHPAQQRYGELADLRKLFENTLHNSGNQEGVSQVSWCPDQLSTQTLIEYSQAIVTCQGTIGLECSCYGVPAIVAGAPFYRDFGFTHQPSSIADYRDLLRRSGELPRLSEEQQKMAKAVYGALSLTNTADENLLIDAELLDLVWGYRKPSNSDAAFTMLARRLSVNSPREQKLFRRAREISPGE